MSNPSAYYQSTDAAPPAGLVMMLLGGLFGAVIGGGIYGPLDSFNPFIYFNFLATLGAGFAGGVGVLMAGHAGKVRNRNAYRVLGVLAGLVALYVSWVGWMWHHLGQEAVITDPQLLWFLIQRVNEVGAWNIRGLTPTGIALYGIWGVEAALLVWIAYSTANTDHEPFCESCDSWTDEQKQAVLGQCEDLKALHAELEAGNLDVLESVVPPGAGAEEHPLVRLDLYKCPRCFSSNFVSAIQLVITVDKEGKEEVEETPIFTHLRLNQGAHDRVKARGEILTSSPAPTPRVDAEAEPAE